MLNFNEGSAVRDFGQLGGRHLLKYCKTDHHPSQENATLRLGCLHEFRKEEMGELADKDEGFYRYNLRLDGGPYTKDTIGEARWLFRVSDDRPQASQLMPGGASNTHIRRYAERNQDGGLIYANGDATVEYSFPESYIFCMSAMQSKTAPSPFEKQTDSWRLKSKSVRPFAETLVTSIQEMHLAGKINFYLGPNREKLLNAAPTAHVRTSLISYDKRIMNINGSESPIEKVAAYMWNNPFSKPASYEAESEFRIHIFFTKGCIPVQPDGEALFLPIEQFYPYIDCQELF